MIKMYCDKCGKEIRRDTGAYPGLRLQGTTTYISAAICMQQFEKDFCEDCAKGILVMIGPVGT